MTATTNDGQDVTLRACYPYGFLRSHRPRESSCKRCGAPFLARYTHNANEPMPSNSPLSMPPRRCTVCGLPKPLLPFWAIFPPYLVAVLCAPAHVRSLVVAHLSLMASIVLLGHTGAVASTLQSLLASTIHGYITPYEVVATTGLIALAVVWLFRYTLGTILWRLLRIAYVLLNPLAKQAPFRYRGWAWLWSVTSPVVTTVLALTGVIPVYELHRWWIELPALVMLDVFVARLHPLRLLADVHWAVVSPVVFTLRGGWLPFRRALGPSSRYESPYDLPAVNIIKPTTGWTLVEQGLTTQGLSAVSTPMTLHLPPIGFDTGADTGTHDA